MRGVKCAYTPCRKTIRPKSEKHRFCCDEHRALARRHVPLSEPVACIECGVKYVRRNFSQRACSMLCRERNYARLRPSTKDGGEAEMEVARSAAPDGSKMLPTALVSEWFKHAHRL